MRGDDHVDDCMESKLGHQQRDALPTQTITLIKYTVQEVQSSTSVKNESPKGGNDENITASTTFFMYARSYKVP